MELSEEPMELQQRLIRVAQQPMMLQPMLAGAALVLPLILLSNQLNGDCSTMVKIY